MDCRVSDVRTDSATRRSSVPTIPDSSTTTPVSRPREGVVLQFLEGFGDGEAVVASAFAHSDVTGRPRPKRTHDFVAVHKDTSSHATGSPRSGAHRRGGPDARRPQQPLPSPQVASTSANGRPICAERPPGRGRAAKLPRQGGRDGPSNRQVYRCCRRVRRGVGGNDWPGGRFGCIPWSGIRRGSCEIVEFVQFGSRDIEATCFRQQRIAPQACA
jgi:hypothetical protein